MALSDQTNRERWIAQAKANCEHILKTDPHIPNRRRAAADLEALCQPATEKTNAA